MYKYRALTTRYESQCDLLNSEIPRRAFSIETIATDVERLYGSIKGEEPRDIRQVMVGSTYELATSHAQKVLYPYDLVEPIISYRVMSDACTA